MAARPLPLFRAAPFAFAGSLTLVLLPLVMPAGASAQSAVTATEEEPVQVENSRNRFLGKAKANGVFVRSGPSSGAYPTMKLNEGAEVTVVGMRHDWLKIAPPPGSYSLVPKSKVNRRGVNGKVGRTNDVAIVRAGSTLTRVKLGAQLKLEPGTDVTILDEEDEYYKIEPPAGAYVYVNQKDVRAIGPMDERGVLIQRPGGNNGGDGNNAARPQPAPGNEVARGNDPQPPAGNDAPLTTETPAPGGAAERDTPPGRQILPEPTEGAQATAAPATQPSEPAGIARFQELEQQFQANLQKHITEQPLAELQRGYEELLAGQGKSLPTSTRRIAEARLAAIKTRVVARQQYEDFLKTREEARQRQQALAAEHEEIKERVEQTRVEVYTAVGTLRVSSLQQGEGTLYRLTDPANGRTIAYVRTNDPKYGRLLNQFVGVRGQVTQDARLNARVIAPTEAEPVEPGRVNDGVIAQIVPPSLIRAEASTPQGPAAE